MDATTQSKLWELSQSVAVLLNAPASAVFREAVDQSATSPCTAEEILTAWEAIAKKNGVPRQLKNYVKN